MVLFLGQVKLMLIHPAHVKTTGLLEPEFNSGNTVKFCLRSLLPLVDLGRNSVGNRVVTLRKILFRAWAETPVDLDTSCSVDSSWLPILQDWGGCNA